MRAWPLELVNGEPLAASLVAEEIEALREQVAPDLFERFDPTTFPESSIPAMTLAASAYRRSPRLGEGVSLALRDALFERGLDVGAADVLAELASDHGLEPSDHADDRTIAADWAEGRRRGVLGSPHFFVGAEGFFCPALEIQRVGGHLRVSANRTRFEAFVARALGSEVIHGPVEARPTAAG